MIVFVKHSLLSDDSEYRLYFLLSDNPEVADISEEVSTIRNRFDTLTASIEERGTSLETISTKVKNYNVSYVEISQWLERAETFQFQQKGIEENLKNLKGQIKEQKVLDFGCSS